MLTSSSLYRKYVRVTSKDSTSLIGKDSTGKQWRFRLADLLPEGRLLDVGDDGWVDYTESEAVARKRISPYLRDVIGVKPPEYPTSSFMDGTKLPDSLLSLPAMSDKRVVEGSLGIGDCLSIVNQLVSNGQLDYAASLVLAYCTGAPVGTTITFGSVVWFGIPGESRLGLVYDKRLCVVPSGLATVFYTWWAACGGLHVPYNMYLPVPAYGVLEGAWEIAACQLGLWLADPDIITAAARGSRTTWKYVSSSPGTKISTAHARRNHSEVKSLNGVVYVSHGSSWLPLAQNSRGKLAPPPKGSVWCDSNVSHTPITRLFRGNINYEVS